MSSSGMKNFYERTNLECRSVIEEQDGYIYNKISYVYGGLGFPKTSGGTDSVGSERCGSDLIMITCPSFTSSQLVNHMQIQWPRQHVKSRSSPSHTSSFSSSTSNRNV